MVGASLAVKPIVCKTNMSDRCRDNRFSTNTEKRRMFPFDSVCTRFHADEQDIELIGNENSFFFLRDVRTNAFIPFDAIRSQFHVLLGVSASFLLSLHERCRICLYAFFSSRDLHADHFSSLLLLQAASVVPFSLRCRSFSLAHLDHTDLDEMISSK